ncbi:hypothetical protein L3X38_010419 [Prunus dulcis]|uniref:Uncharacterized protein n=1 Tax=Prunus dulcis TaxID=3755 RepID=A0AAD4WH32_PRUDU|nr:hypothetical protein L3X38_010419 [Prunus dulcis]
MARSGGSLQAPDSKVDKEGSSYSEMVSLLMKDAKALGLSKVLFQMTSSPESQMKKPQKVLGISCIRSFMVISKSDPSCCRVCVEISSTPG